jgi:DNA polymerase I
MKKLFLLDALALIYRAHFAFSKAPRLNSRGMNTGAVLGFTNSLLDIIEKQKPTHIGIAYDMHGPTFRHIEFPEYKAQREAQPEDITVAIPYTEKICEAFQIPILKLAGYEADDIIGTFAKKAARLGFEVYMMTPDKDYGQLVEESIFLYKPAYLGNEVEIMGIEQIKARWNIENVDQVRDILGLQGDAVDNIPGIPGIGEKTAAKLLAEFGTVENLVANADKLKGKQKENVINFGAQGILSKKLATIDINSPIEFEEEKLKYNGFNEPMLRNLFDELEFRTLKKRIFGDTPNAPTPSQATEKGKKTDQIDIFGGNKPSPLFVSSQTSPSALAHTDDSSSSSPLFASSQANPEYTPKAKDTIDSVLRDYQLIDSAELRQQLIYFLGLQAEFSMDTETTTVDAYEAELVGLSFSYRKGEGFYVPIPAEPAEARKIVWEFKEVFENEKIKKIGQNIKYDMMVLRNYDIELKGELFDTMLAHYLLEPDGRHNMDILAENYLNYSPVSIEGLIGKGKNQGSMRDVEMNLIKDYAAEDADVTWQLKEVFEPMIKAQGIDSLFDTVENPLVYVLSDMERNGVRIDLSALSEFSKILGSDMKLTEQQIFTLAGMEFNISSPKQLGDILFEKLKLLDKPTKTKTGQYATGEEVLVKLAEEHQIVREILVYRELQKLKSTYVDALPQMISPKDGLVHTSYNQAVAATGRLSSNNPNLQNIPIRTEKGKEIRKAFVPRNEDFTLLSADYSQIELRIMAHLSQDPVMIEAFVQNKDIHAETAAKLYKIPLSEVNSDMRRKAKTANFGIIYGISAFGLSQRLNIPRKEAQGIIEAYFAEFSSIKKYMDEAINFARDHEYVETILKRRRYLRDINSRNHTQRSFAERNAINNPIQGSAADMIKMAMIKVHDWMRKEKMKSKMLLQVHDELVFDAHYSEVEKLSAGIKELMSQAVSLRVPIEVECGTGKNWLEAH